MQMEEVTEPVDLVPIGCVVRSHKLFVSLFDTD